MKNILKTIVILLVLIGTTISCTESDNSIDTLLNDVDQTGVILRTLSAPLELVNVSNEDINQIEVTFEVQEANGDIDPDFKEVRVYVNLYKDQDLIDSLEDGLGGNISETLLMTLTPDMFTTSANGLPSTDVYFDTQDVVDIYPDATYVTPSFLDTRLEIEMNDGRVFSKDNVAATVATGAYFNSPFSYISIFLNM